MNTLALAPLTRDCGHALLTDAQRLALGEQMLSRFKRDGLPERSRWNEARTASTVAWKVRLLRREFHGRAQA